MAIRFKYDATGVVVPQNASNRKYGQALVLQQKRLEDDQKLLAQQQQMLNRQRQGMQQPLMMNAQQQAANRQQLGQRQGLANLNAGFGANMAPAANAQQPAGNAANGMAMRLKAMDRSDKAQQDAGVLNPAVPGPMPLMDQRFGPKPDMGYPTSQSLMERQQSAEMEQQMAVQMQAQERAGFEEARKAGEYDNVTAAKIKQTYEDAIKTDLSKDLDAGMKAEWNAENNAKRSKLLENRNPNPSLVDQANNGLIYFDPRIGKNVDKFEPGVGMTTIDTINKKERVDPVLKTPEPTPQLPTSYEGYAEMDFEKSVKALAAKKEELRAKAEDSDDPYKDEDKLRTDAYAALKGDYDFTLSQIAAAKQQSQPATPPPATPAPPTGMQNLEPSYNADGTGSDQSSPARAVQPNGDLYYTSAPTGVQPPPLPNPQAIEDTLYPQSARSGWDDADQPQAAPATPDELKSKLGELQKVVANTESEIYNLTLRQTAADQSGNAEASAKLKSEIYNLVTTREQAIKGISEARAKIDEPPIKPGQSDALRKLDIDKAKLENNLASNKVQLDNIRNKSVGYRVTEPIVGAIIDQANAYQERMGMAPESEVVEKQPLTNEQYLIRDRDETLKALEEINKKIAQASPAAGAKKAAPPVQPVSAPVQASATQPQSPMDMISEVKKTFESGTPEQKATLREKMNSPENITNLETQAVAGNKDAVEAAKLLKAELTPSDMVADAIVLAKKDGAGAVAKLKKQKESGALTDESYTAAIVANSGKTAKQNYETIIKNLPAKKGLGAFSIDNRESRNERNTLNAIWGEMGMYDSRSYVRAFQKEPTMDDVIKNAMEQVNKKGGVQWTRKDAEEWVYNQFLSRNYSEDVQLDFQGMLTMNRARDRENKQKIKRDSWTPNTK